MIDIDLLKLHKTPYDELVHVLRANINVSPFLKLHTFEPLRSYVTLSLVEDPHIRKTAKIYILELIRNKSHYGFLYHLHSQKLLIPLNLYFNSELILDPLHHYPIMEAIQNIARDVFCPHKENKMYDITKIELLYFFTLLANYHLNWVTVDHILGCNRSHGYLVASPKRLMT